MNLSKPVVLLFCIFCCIQLFGQGKGEVRMHVSPYKGMEYIVDGKDRMNNPALSLPEGDHKFVLWAPGRQMLDTTIRVIADSTVALYKVLPVSAEYRAYTVDRKRKKNSVFFTVVAPALITMGSGVFTMISVKNTNETKETLQNLEQSYYTLRTPGSIRTLKSEAIPTAQENYETVRRNMMIGASVTTVAAAVTIWGLIRTSKRKQPTFEDKEKLKFDGLVWIPGQYGGFFAGLTLPIR